MIVLVTAGEVQESLVPSAVQCLQFLKGLVQYASQDGKFFTLGRELRRAVSWQPCTQPRMINHRVVSCVTLGGGRRVSQGNLIQREGGGTRAGRAGWAQRCNMGTGRRGKSDPICVLRNCGISLKNIMLITLQSEIRRRSGEHGTGRFLWSASVWFLLSHQMFKPDLSLYILPFSWQNPDRGR